MSTEQLAAIERLKSCPAQVKTLAFPSPDAQLSLMVHASKTAIGAVLNQGEGDHRQLLAFISKALQPSEQRYSTFGQELLAAYLSVKHFRHYAEGGRLIVFTDHKPLISAMASHSWKYTEREIRQSDFLCQFDLEFRHVRGSENEVADALSRIEINSLQFPPGIDCTEIAAKQQREGNTSHMVPDLATLPFGDNILFVCDQSTGVPGPVVSVYLRRKIFNTLHGLDHPGIKASVGLIMESFAWNGLQKDVREWTRCCIPCQTIKVHRHKKAPIGTFDVPDARFHHDHIDLVGPLSPSPGHRFILTCVDRFTGRWSTVTPIPSSSPSFRTGLLDLAHQKLSQSIAVPSLNQRFSPNCVNSWVASVSEQPRITQPPTEW